MSSSFYPKLSDILDIDVIPDDFEFLKESIVEALDNIRYRNLILAKSKGRDRLFFSSDLLIENTFQLKIPGTELLLRLNPPPQGESSLESDIFKVLMFYNWG